VSFQPCILRTDHRRAIGSGSLQSGVGDAASVRTHKRNSGNPASCSLSPDATVNRLIGAVRQSVEQGVVAQAAGAGHAGELRHTGLDMRLAVEGVDAIDIDAVAETGAARLDARQGEQELKQGDEFGHGAPLCFGAKDDGRPPLRDD